jgi:hypothetical protein
MQHRRTILALLGKDLVAVSATLWWRVFARSRWQFGPRAPMKMGVPIDADTKVSNLLLKHKPIIA